MKKFFGEFKEFISKGNVIDMAIGVVVGGAFKTIVDSLVKDVIMPVIGWLLGDLDFSKFVVTLRPAEMAEDNVTVIKEAITINYGVFINAIISFIIIGFCLFCVVKIINKLRRNKEEPVEEEPAAEPEPTTEEKLLTEIRDLLKEKNS